LSIGARLEAEETLIGRVGVEEGELRARAERVVAGGLDGVEPLQHAAPDRLFRRIDWREEEVGAAGPRAAVTAALPATTASRQERSAQRCRACGGNAATAGDPFRKRVGPGIHVRLRFLGETCHVSGGFS